MKNTNSPTHEAIAQRAQEIWLLRGNPVGHDTAIWLEAERQLGVESPQPHSGSLVEAKFSAVPFDRKRAAAKDRTESRVTEPAPVPLPVVDAPVPDPDEIAAKAARQKQSARAPRLPTHKDATKPAAPVSGKPIWDKPHSS